MDEDNKSLTGPLLPLTLIAITAIFFLLSQLSNIRQVSSSMTWQNDRGDKQIKKLEELQATLTKNIESNRPTVAQSEQLQKRFQEMMKDLDDLRRGGDKDAERIIKGYGIQVNDGAPADDKKDPEKKKEP